MDCGWIALAGLVGMVAAGMYGGLTERMNKKPRLQYRIKYKALPENKNEFRQLLQEIEQTYPGALLHPDDYKRELIINQIRKTTWRHAQ